MNWSSWSDFFAMGGYGLYVWGSFGMCAAVLVLEVVLLALRRRGVATQVPGQTADIKESGA